MSFSIHEYAKNLPSLDIKELLVNGAENTGIGNILFKTIKEHEKWPTIKYLLDKIADFIQWVTNYNWTPDIGSLEGRIERFNMVVNEHQWQERFADTREAAELPSL